MPDRINVFGWSLAEQQPDGNWLIRGSDPDKHGLPDNEPFVEIACDNANRMRMAGSTVRVVAVLMEPQVDCPTKTIRRGEDD